MQRKDFIPLENHISLVGGSLQSKFKKWEIIFLSWQHSSALYHTAKFNMKTIEKYEQNPF